MGEAAKDAFFFFFFCIERTAETRKHALLVPTIKLSNTRADRVRGRLMVLASQDSGEEILGMKCLGRLQKKKVWEVMNFKMPKI